MHPSIISHLLSMHAGVGDTVVTLISKILHRHYTMCWKTCCVVRTHVITQHIRHLTNGRLENTSAANALMLMPDKLKLRPPQVEHEPFLVSRPEGSTRNMQSPKKATAPNPHKYRGLCLHEVSKEPRAGTREQKTCLTRNNFVSA
jgi:hypothetical protein